MPPRSYCGEADSKSCRRCILVLRTLGALLKGRCAAHEHTSRLLLRKAMTWLTIRCVCFLLTAW